MHPLLVIALLAAAFGAPAQAAAQAQGSDTPAAERIYRREVFDYSRPGRPDPFRSLLNSAELGIRYEDLSLRGVLYNPESGTSVAVLWDEAGKRRFQGRVGDRFGGITIVGITPRRVDLLIMEFGVSRRESLELKAQPQTGTES